MRVAGSSWRFLERRFRIISGTSHHTRQYGRVVSLDGVSRDRSSAMAHFPRADCLVPGSPCPGCARFSASLSLLPEHKPSVHTKHRCPLREPLEQLTRTAGRRNHENDTLAINEHVCATAEPPSRGAQVTPSCGGSCHAMEVNNQTHPLSIIAALGSCLYQSTEKRIKICKTFGYEAGLSKALTALPPSVA